MRRVARRQRQQQARLLAARHQPDLEVAALAGKAEAAELGAHLVLGRARPERAIHVAERRAFVVETLFLVLREVADAELGAAPHLALARRELVGEQADEGRLAVAVLAEQ